MQAAAVAVVIGDEPWAEAPHRDFAVIFFALLDPQDALIAHSEAQSVVFGEISLQTGAMRWVPLLHSCPPFTGPRDARSHDLQFEAERNKKTARS
jgi:hypothetical protein